MNYCCWVNCKSVVDVFSDKIVICLVVFHAEIVEICKVYEILQKYIGKGCEF